jgi:methionyl-tRNA synthetase
MDAVRARYETELANEYGNLGSRTIAMIQRYRDGVIPAVVTDDRLAREFEVLPAEVAAVLDRADPTRALELIWHRVRRLNRYVEERAPWQLARDPEAADELDQVLASLADGVRVVSVLLHAYMPASTERLLIALGAPEVTYERALFAERGSGLPVQALEPLFPKRA